MSITSASKWAEIQKYLDVTSNQDYLFIRMYISFATKHRTKLFVTKLVVLSCCIALYGDKVGNFQMTLGNILLHCTAEIDIP